ncbi:hypothetical protein [Noviherbaspirillum malthae]|uniref:hypothetical protein n=1 Tax=Noviherbaspirillum malthae TaxID=1260987 RepID=UPI00188DFD34|nr:hypothetical protein [Noviherbaspirillum malthae]
MMNKTIHYLNDDAGVQARRALARPGKRKVARRVVVRGARLRTWIRIVIGCHVTLLATLWLLE